MGFGEVTSLCALPSQLHGGARRITGEMVWRAAEMCLSRSDSELIACYGNLHDEARAKGLNHPLDVTRPLTSDQPCIVLGPLPDLRPNPTIYTTRPLVQFTSVSFLLWSQEDLALPKLMLMHTVMTRRLQIRSVRYVKTMGNCQGVLRCAELWGRGEQRRASREGIVIEPVATTAPAV